MLSTKAVHQEHVNCLINTWVFACLNMAVNSVRRGFLCHNRSLSILLHGVISLPDAPSYDRYKYISVAVLFWNPTIHLTHTTKPILCYEEGDRLNEMDHEFNKCVDIFLSIKQ